MDNAEEALIIHLFFLFYGQKSYNIGYIQWKNDPPFLNLDINRSVQERRNSIC